MAEKPPFFIIGCPRSGTSLVSRVLDSHHRLGVPYESHIFNIFYPWFEDYGDLADPASRSRLIDDILATDVLGDWQPRPTREQVHAALREASFGGIFDAVLRAWIRATGKQRWGEKTPQHVFYWEAISRFFPEAQVIHIVRDGRDVALSWISARFGPKTVYGAAREWSRYLAAVERLKQTTAPERICEIRYEDLVTAPQAIAMRLCEFLDEDFDPNMLHFYKNDQTLSH